MSLFTVSTGDFAVLQTKGVFIQEKLYTLNGRLFAQSGKGFIGLYADKATTKPDTRIYYLETDKYIYKDATGRLYYKKAADRTLFRG